MGLMFPIYFISTIVTAGLSLITASQILDLSDLDCDYINPRQCCIRLNRLISPEILLVGLLVLLHGATMNWIPLSTFLPVLAYLIYSYPLSSRGYASVFDASTIKDQNVINQQVRRCFFRTIFYIINFVLFLYYSVLELATT